MKAALIALDSTECSGTNFERFSEAIRIFQEKGILPQAEIASVYHSSLTTFPHEIYEKEKGRLALEARTKIQDASMGRFDFSSARVLLSPSPCAEDHVQSLSQFGKRHGADLLVVGSHDRSGLPHWLLGSFSETAALHAELPVLILKTGQPTELFSKAPRFVFAIDVASPPPRPMLHWICDVARSAEAILELVYVIPRYRPILDSFQSRRSRRDAENEMRRLKNECESLGTNTRVHIIDETISVAHALSDFADEARAWLVAVFAAERPSARKLVLGSRARRLLALTKRPFLSLRFT